MSLDTGKHKGTLIIVAGPSAVGKGTIVKELKKRYPDLFVSVSVTTRPPRPDEVDGRDYHFISEDEFQVMVAHNDLLESALVHQTHHYGTPKTPVQQCIDAGNPALLEIDVNGAFQVKDKMPDAYMIFIAPPSWQELERRLLGRGSENYDQRRRRLRTAHKEMALRERFDAIVINDDLDTATDEVAHLMSLA
ncbi:MAG: guanylate kinase [Actinomycetaceae bacterium]|nr:guanylate kinase [Actinomycetaceae bacterium]